LGFKKTFKTFRFLKQTLFTKRPRIGYVGGYQGHKNLGDEALYAALRQLFSSGNFIDYNKKFLPQSIVRHLPKCDLMLMAGGTIVGGQKASSYQWVQTCFTVAPHRIIFGSGVVSPDFATDVLKTSLDVHRQWVDVLRQCDYIGVRGPLSKAVLMDLGINNAEVIGDPVLSISRNKMPDTCSINNNLIGFNVGQAGGNVWGNEEHIYEQFVKLAQIADKAGFRIRWFVVWPKDLAVTEQVVHNSGVPADICEIYNDYEKYLDMVSQTNVFVGMKLHAVALATCAYVPSLMLEYNPKCRDYMESICQAESMLRTDEFAAHQAWEKVNRLLEKRLSVSKSLFEAVSGFRKLQVLRASQLSAKFGLKPTKD
jgi:polysaccharide pyruvyl transferase WcaK-like protein